MVEDSIENLILQILKVQPQTKFKFKFLKEERIQTSEFLKHQYELHI